MHRKQAKYRHIILLERRRGRPLAELPQLSPPQREQVPQRSLDRPPTTNLRLAVPHPQTDPILLKAAPEPCPSSFVRRGFLNDDAQCKLPPYARRKFRGWIVTYFDVRRVQRLIPVKSENFRLRFRNLSYKRKWNLVWC